MRNNQTANSMESFYDKNGQFAPETTTANNNNNNGNGLKRPATLELKQPQRKRFNNQQNATVLGTPDIQLLKMASPELEKFLAQPNLHQTLTPSIFHPTKVTTEQEGFAKGFEDALLSLQQNNHNKNNNNNNIENISKNQQITIVTSVPSGTTSTHNTMSGGEMTYTNLDNFPVAIKDEPQQVPQSPPLSPIDMENQERIKLERKRLRNRVAASKCRRRKLERISKLEDKVKNLKTENSDLGSIVFSLKQHVIQLKQQVIEHVNSGCKIKI